MTPQRRATDSGPEQAELRRKVAADTAATVFACFEAYNDEFREITRRARRRFEDREWKLGQRDAKERIDLYERHVERCIVRLVRDMGGSVADQATWRELKSSFAELIASCPDSEFFKTFFNSLSRTIFGTIGVNPELEFVAFDLAPALGASGAPVRRYTPAATLADTARTLLAQFETDLPFLQPESSIEYLCLQIEAALPETAGEAGFDCIEMLTPVFYRSSRALLVGRLISGDTCTPLILAYRNAGGGVILDAVITDDREVRMLFGYSRSYFHVDLETVGATVGFLSSIMPSKAAGEFFTVLGRAKQGKTERYRSLFKHLQASTDKFVHADGERGMVMIVFSLPSLDIVFKVIRDKFPEPKITSRREVMNKYQFVFMHDRVGRLVDAQEFKRLRFPKNRFSPEVLEELMSDAKMSCRIDGDDIIIEHCYIERRLRPLNLYLNEVEPAVARQSIIDYGQAIRDLARTNIFPGDLLIKNFGVSRHARVIFYDYDELCLVTDCRFRDVPKAQFEEDEMRAEPWFYVGPEDVFPEQFLDFLGIPPKLRDVFVRYHSDLLTAEYWRRLKSRHQREEHLEVIPYTRQEIDAEPTGRHVRIA